MRLIDADKIKWRPTVSTMGLVIPEGQAYFVRKADIDDMPAVDAKAITRCKDCILYRETGSVSCCTRSWDPVTRNDFCSYAMRKDGKEQGK